jgi:hypothetical protein
VSPDDPVTSDKANAERRAALDREVRAFLGQRLRAYYDHIRQMTVSDALAELLHEIELKGEANGEAGPGRQKHVS